MPAPLPFPELPDLILKIMARRPDAPNTVRTLWDQVVEEVPDRVKPGLVDVEHVLTLLRHRGEVLDSNNTFKGQVWKLTILGKLNQGIS